MTERSVVARGPVLALGIGDVASAVAHRLHEEGFTVTIQAGPEPPLAHRRAMAFADAWWDGSAMLEGVTACMVAVLKTGPPAGPGACMPFVLRTAGPTCIPIAAVPPDGLLRADSFAVLVDARMRKRATPERLRGRAPLTIGLGPGFRAGDTVDLAIETAWGERLGAVVRRGPTLALAGEPRSIEGVGRERLVYAPHGGRFLHAAVIGRPVAAGEPIATLDQTPIVAPIAGTLRGIVRSGIDPLARTKLLEVDPRPPERAVFTGLGERSRRIAQGVMAAVHGP